MNKLPSTRDIANELYRKMKLEVTQYFTVDEIECIIKSSNNNMKESAELVRAMYEGRKYNRTNNVSDNRFFLTQLERLRKARDEELGLSP